MNETCTSDIKLITNLRNVTNFLEKYLQIANAHMVDFITLNHWNLLDKNIQNELLSLSRNEIVNVHEDWCLKTIKETRLHLYKFVIEVKSHLLEHVAIQLDSIQHSLQVAKTLTSNHLAKRMMSPKKHHEVEQMGYFVASMARKYDIDTVLDLGSGKGYLSSYLALLYNLNVVGLDSSPTNTQNAAKRNEKLTNYVLKQKHNFNSLKKQFNIEQEILEKLKIEDSSGHKEQEKKQEENMRAIGTFKPVTSFVNFQTNLDQMMKDIWPDNKSYAMCGLHTCGNLSPAILQHFLACKHSPFLVQLGCCYHLLKESFEASYQEDKLTLSTEPEGSSQDNAEYGFPLSSFLKERKISLGYNARNLSSHCWSRFSKTIEVSNKAVLYRAIFQVILSEALGYYPEDHPVGCIGTKNNSFTEYVRLALVKTKREGTIKLSDQQIEEYFNRYQHLQHQLDAFQQLRILLAPTIEALILLDRLMYLKEQDSVLEAKLIQLFDRETSPRCYAILAIKNKKGQSCDSNERKEGVCV